MYLGYQSTAQLIIIASMDKSDEQKNEEIVLANLVENLGIVASNPLISAACQALSILWPGTNIPQTFFSQKYANDQLTAIKQYLDELDTKVGKIENNMIDKKFFDSPQGRRIIVKMLRAVVNDGRKEKIEKLAILTVNLQLKTHLTIDEKETYLAILDDLNPLQLTILTKVVTEMRARTTNPHRGLGWEEIAKTFSEAGISNALVLHALSVLESNGLINRNDATIQEADKTHLITDFGEQFFDFINTVLRPGNKYIIC